MAISETKGRVESYRYPVQEGQWYINLNPGRLFIQQPPKRERDREAHLNYRSTRSSIWCFCIWQIGCIASVSVVVWIVVVFQGPGSQTSILPKDCLLWSLWSGRVYLGTAEDLEVLMNVLNITYIYIYIHTYDLGRVGCVSVALSHTFYA